MAKVEEADGYYVGSKAWDAYVGAIEGLEQADDDARKAAMTGNSWIYECLASFRGVAAEYLRGAAEEFDPPTSDRLLAAADLYDRMSNEVLRDKDTCVLSIAPLPWSLKEGETWTSEMRQDQLRRMNEAFLLEQQAIREIEEALGAMG